MVNIIEQSNGVKKVTIQTPYEGVNAAINALSQTVAGKADKTDVNGKANQSDLDATNAQLAEIMPKVVKVSISDYSSVGNANYFNSADGKFYTDSSLTTIAHDDTQSLLNALTHLASFQNAVTYNRPIVYFPNGNYLFSQNILIQNMQHVTFVGEGIDSTTLHFNSIGDFISLGVSQPSPTNYWSGTAQGFQASNLTIRKDSEDNAASNASRKSNAIVDNGSGGVILANVKIRGFKNGFYGVMGSDFSILSKVTLFNNDVGIYLGAGAEQVQLTNINFTMCNEGLVMERAGQGEMTNCWFVDNYVSDITVESNTTLRTGLPLLSGTSNDLNWSWNDCWFETGAGYNNNADHQNHIIFRGNSGDNCPRGIKINKPILISGTTGMGTKDGSKKYSFIRVEQGTYNEINDLHISGSRIDCVVDILSGYFPTMVQRNTRTEDGYTVAPLWNNQADGCVSYDFRGQTLSAHTNNAYYEIDNQSTGMNFRLKNNGDNTISFMLYTGGTWLERMKMDLANSWITFNGQILRFASAMPTSSTYTKGDEVRNTNPSVLGSAGSQYIVSGWKRMTTGSNHVLNTDWVEMRTLTGS